MMVSLDGLVGVHQVDVYSFGIVLWELWTGVEPYDGLNYHALLHQMTSNQSMTRPPLPGQADWEASYPDEPAPGYQALVSPAHLLSCN